jgi:hypothetical protein
MSAADDRVTAALAGRVPPMDGESSADGLRRVLTILARGVEHPLRDADGRRYCACGCGRTIPLSGRSDRKTFDASCRKRLARAAVDQSPATSRLSRNGATTTCDKCGRAVTQKGGWS